MFAYFVYSIYESLIILSFFLLNVNKKNKLRSKTIKQALSLQWFTKSLRRSMSIRLYANVDQKEAIDFFDRTKNETLYRNDKDVETGSFYSINLLIVLMFSD